MTCQQWLERKRKVLAIFHYVVGKPAVCSLLEVVDDT
jgi:hypothetical protein